MGQSTDAYLFYGYCWQDEYNDFDTDMDGVVKKILTQRGMTDPWEAHYVGEQPYENYKAWAATPEGSAEVEAEKQVKSELGVEWDSRCSGDYPIPFLHISGTRTRASRGTAKPITSVDVDPAWKGKLDAFLASQQIEAPEGENQPGWWLASYWG